ncbi:MAG: LarC family nickel insertion protein [Lachnospiraceae bacterium]|nr:LarC family nickel insertion protein [Lachnospiraceae bacterium]
MDKGKSLYLECYSGISGDMVAAALLDLGASEERLRAVLKSLPLPGFEIRISETEKSGIRAKDFDVLLEQENHDHDMDYLYGREEHIHDGAHTHDMTHTHDGTHTHSEEAHPHHHHPHQHRTLKDIREIYDHSVMSDDEKRLALGVFDIVAGAEGFVHGRPKEEVHFHEVGAVDSIVDIAAAAVCLNDLGFSKAIVSVLYEGFGTVRCQHGVLPVPVPAVARIVSEHGLLLHPMGLEGEFVTPTGAAIAASLSDGRRLPERYTIEKIGIGAGKRVYDGPGILRAMKIREEA